MKMGRIVAIGRKKIKKNYVQMKYTAKCSFSFFFSISSIRLLAHVIPLAIKNKKTT